jgi:Trypsin-co-occurring domain 1
LRGPVESFIFQSRFLHAETISPRWRLSEVAQLIELDVEEVEFAVKNSADSKVIIARAAGEANFRIVLRWSREAGG